MRDPRECPICGELSMSRVGPAKLEQCGGADDTVEAEVWVCGSGKCAGTVDVRPLKEKKP